MAAKNDLIVRLLLDNAQFVGGVRSSSKEMMRMRASIEKGTDILDSFTGGLVKGAMKFASWGAAAAAAGKVLTDAFMSSEQFADDYRRMQEQANSAYNTFVTSIESGNWSNFFSNMSAAISSARELYDAFDRLGSIRQNDMPLIAQQQAVVKQLRMQIADNNLSPRERKSLQKQLEVENKKLTNLRKKEAKASMDAGLKGIEQSLLERGVSKKQAQYLAKKMVSESGGQALYDYADKEIRKLKKKITTVISTNTEGIITTQEVNSMTADERRRYNWLQAIKQGESDANRIKGLEAYTQGFNIISDIAMQNMRDNRYMQRNVGDSSRTGGAKTVAAAKQEAEAGSLNYISETISRLRRERGNTLDTSKQAAIDAQISELVAQRIRLNYGDRKMETIGASAAPTTFVGVDGAAEQLSEKIKKIKEAQEATNMLRKELTDDAMQSSVYGLIDAFGALGDVVGGTAGKFISFAAQSAASIAQLLAQNAQLLASAQAAALGGAAKSAFQLPFPFNLAMWASLSATVLGIFASLPKFAEGGIVGGLSGGDRNLARVNAGEMILNNTQQRRLFAMLDGKAAPQGGAVTFRISGDALVGVIENYNRKTRATL